MSPLTCHFPKGGATERPHRCGLAATCAFPRMHCSGRWGFWDDHLPACHTGVGCGFQLACREGAPSQEAAFTSASFATLCSPSPFWTWVCTVRGQMQMLAEQFSGGRTTALVCSFCHCGVKTPTTVNSRLSAPVGSSTALPSQRWRTQVPQPRAEVVQV